MKGKIIYENGEIDFETIVEKKVYKSGTNSFGISLPKRFEGKKVYVLLPST